MDPETDIQELKRRIECLEAENGALRRQGERDRRLLDSVRESESEKKFRLMFENAPLAYQSLDIEGRFIEVNRAWLDALGYRREEVLGRSFADFLHPDWREHFKFNFPRFKAVGEVLGVEFTMVKKNGEQILVSFNGKIGKNEKGEFQRTHCILRDITSQREFQDRLRRSEREKAAILNGLKDVIVEYVDRDMKIIWTNATMGKEFGYAPEDLVGRTCYKVVQGLSAPCPRCTAVKAFETGEFHEGEVETPEGRTFIVRSNPVRDDDGGIVGVVHAALDISERKRMERALRWESAVNRAAAELAQSILIPPENLFEINRSILEYARKMTGSRHGFVSVIEPETGDNVSTTLTDMMQNGECTMRDGRIVFPRGEDGAYPKLWGHALNTCTPFYTNAPSGHGAAGGLPAGHIPIERFLAVPVVIDGEPGGLIALANPERDYTDKDLEAVEQLGRMFALALHRQRYQDNWRALQRKLQQSQKLESLGVLAGGIAHDFNNMLFPIIGYAEMTLERLPKGSPLRKFQEAILKSAFRARDLVRQILAFSRQGETKPSPVKCQVIIKEVLKLIRATIPVNIRIDQDVDDQCGPVLGDPTHIHSLVMNLCTNAYHAMEENGGRLSVGLKEIDLPAAADGGGKLPAGPYIRLTVRDTGMGIDASVLDRIFEPYFTTKEQGKGVGLGLSVVHGIVTAGGGDIRVSSKPGRGSVFEVCLPRMENDSDPVEAEREQIVPRGRERILLVDDEIEIVEMVRLMLGRLGYTVTACTRGVEALKQFRSAPRDFDLVITDMAMPDIRGDELAEAVLSIRPDIPVMLCTGFSDRISPEKAAALGIRDYLMKPLRQGELARRIRRAMDGKAAERITPSPAPPPDPR